MTFRKISLTFLMIALGVSCAHAKKTPKYEPTRLLTAEQAALVQKAVDHQGDGYQATPSHSLGSLQSTLDRPGKRNGRCLSHKRQSVLHLSGHATRTTHDPSSSCNPPARSPRHAR